MIYFDNAATGAFKPNAALSSAENTMRYLSVNPGRSGHRLSVTGAQIVYDTRKLLANYFSATPERVIFTKNCTEALNLAILGTAKKGGNVITTVFEHNSVLRPLYHLESQGLISLTVVSTRTENLVSAIENAITDNTYMVVSTAASNVTGEVLPFRKIGALCKKHNLLYLLDGAQGGGHLPLDMKADNLSMLALAGHKGLCSIMGVGALIISDNVSVNPITFGGTGTESFSTVQPEFYPERLESGTLNLPAIASLEGGARYALGNVLLFGSTLLEYTAKLIGGLENVPSIKCYSKPNKCGIVAFSHAQIPSADFADILNERYDIAVRAGLHCAPLMHKFLGTEDSGLVRVSVAPQNSARELSTLLKAIKEISG